MVPDRASPMTAVIDGADRSMSAAFGPWRDVECSRLDPRMPVAFGDRFGVEGPGPATHQAPWGTHRQGGFVDPFGHIWLVGDRSRRCRYRG